MGGFSRPSDAEIVAHDVNPFANLSAEFFQEHAGEVAVIGNDGAVLKTGTMEEVQEYVRLIANEGGVHVLPIPDWSRASEADVLALFGISAKEDEITDETRNALDRMLDDD